MEDVGVFYLWPVTHILTVYLGLRNLDEDIKVRYETFYNTRHKCLKKGSVKNSLGQKIIDQKLRPDVEKAVADGFCPGKNLNYKSSAP